MIGAAARTDHDRLLSMNLTSRPSLSVTLPF